MASSSVPPQPLRKSAWSRRRALAACTLCRERKRKCDNQRPVCSSCRQIGAQCQYGPKDASSFDAPSLAILDQLSLLEGMVREIHANTSRRQAPESAPGPECRRPNEDSPPLHQQPDAVFSLNLDASRRTSADTILEWPVFASFLSPLHRFTFKDSSGNDRHTYLGHPISRSHAATPSVPSVLRLPLSISTERADIDALVDLYFTRVNIKNPILSRHVVASYCHTYCENGPQFDLQTCLVLLTCALGAISTEYDPSDAEVREYHTSDSARRASLSLGKCYYSAAEKRLGAAMTAGDNLAIQCLCLAGIYQMCSLDPVAALRMFHAAGYSMQILLSSGPVVPGEEPSQINSSLFWTCYKSEREILAEMPIAVPALREPPSSDSYPPPPQEASTPSDSWTAAEEDSWYFLLSEIALRNLTDQVAEVVARHIDSHIRSPAASASVQDLIPVIAEFERQAEAFRSLLPPSINFPDVPTAAATEWKQYSRGRYYRLLELMHRPFLFDVVHRPPGTCDPAVRALAEKALFNALRYLQHSHVTHRHHGTWLQLRNELKEASLLLVAARSAAGLSLPEGWRDGVSKALVTLNYWSSEFPQCKTYAEVLLALSKEQVISPDGDTSICYD